MVLQVNKTSPTKAPTKLTPVKPLPAKKLPITTATTSFVRKKSRFSQKKNNSGDAMDNTIIMDVDSPYSPGSNDYEDLFEPPPETLKLSSNSNKVQGGKSGNKNTNTFDALFSASPVVKKSKLAKSKRPYVASKGILINVLAMI